MEEQGGEDASAVAGPHPSRPPGDENPPSSPLSLLPEVDEVGLPHCDEAECAGEAGYCSMPQGNSSSSASPLSGSDAGVLEPAALEPAPDAISAGDVDAVDGEPAWVVAEEADDTPIPQCEQAAGHGEAQVWMPQGFPASSPSRSDRGVEEVVTFEPDAEDTAGADDDPMKEETLRMAVEVAENILIPQWQQRNDDMQEKILMSQGSPAVSPSGSDGGVPKFAALETDTIATTAGDVDAAEEAVLKMDVESVPISQWQKGKDGAQEQVLMPHGSPVVCPSGSDGGLLKIAAFEIDTVAATAGNADAVEDAVLKMDVDNAPTPQGQQGKDGVQEEVLMPQGSPAVSPSGSDCGLVKYAIFETDTTATTAGDDDAVEEAVSKMNVDSGPITADKQVEDCGVADICKQEEDCGEADISMPKSSPSLSPSDSGGGHEKVEACKPDTVATSGDDDAVKEEVAMADADKFDNMPLTLCELMEDAGEAEISMPQGSLSEFPSGSDRAENIAAIEPDTATMSHGSADAMDDESAQMDVEADETRVVVRRGGGRRKRGRPAKTQAARTPSRRKEEEEVCFICFDGGDLVVCDRRGCPKVYHPSCVNRDEAFFRAKGRWSCGWHICSSCERSAHYMCFTCTHSLCRGCIKEAGFFCVRGTKGFCETCMSTVMLIETNEHGNEKMIGVDFDDSSSFEYLFKDYWLSLKAKLSLALEELTGAKNPMKRSDVATGNEESSDDLHNANEEKVASSDSSSERKEESISSRRKVRKRSKNTVNEEGSVKEVENAGTSVSRDIAWASDELLEFVAHMRNGDRSALSQFDVQGLLLDYIKRNNLRDPRRKSQIICDTRLENLFGKPRVGHFEMLKLLESHFFMKEVSPLDTEDKQGGVVDPDPVQIDAKGNNDASTKITPDKRRKTRRKVGEKELLTNLDDFAAIDVHNISLMYLRRNLMEELVDDISFDEKVIGSFVRIRISGVGQRQDMYRLVQVVGTGKAAERYKSGKKTTDITLEILNLNKKEAITIDIISNQEFTEEECKRLRQSIKCGFICRLTVGDVQDKARSLQAVKVNDWLESEKLRLGHLRDRASEKGRRKELRECIEKLQLLNTPEEHNRRLNEVPEIHTDPHMDPDYESAEEEEESDMRKQDYYDRSRGSSFLRNGREVKSPGKGGSTLSDNWSISRKNSNTWESNRSALTEGASIADSSAGRGVNTTEFSLNLANDVCQASSSEAPKNHVTTSVSDANLYNEKQHITRPEQSSDGLQGNQKASLAGGLAAMANTSQSDKIWHYQDPSGKIQGPFSMTQLRKWNTTGYFPPNLRIWKTSEKQEDSLLLSDALVGKLQKDLPEWEPHHNSTSQSMVVSPTVFGAGTNSEGVWRGSDDSALSNSKQNAQKWNIGQNEKWTTRPSSWSSQKREISSRDRILPKDANAKIGQAQGQNSPRPISSHDGNQPQAPPYQAIGSQVSSSGTSDAYKDCGSVWSANKPFVSQTSGQHYENPHANWSSTSQQLSSSTYKIPPVNDSSHQWRNDSSNVPIPTPQPSRKGWSASEDSLHKHLPSSASVQDTALGCATTMRGGEEPESSFTINEPSRSTSNSFRELGSSSAQYVLDQTVISDCGKSLPSASLSAPNTVFLGQTITLTQHPDEVDALGNFQKKNSELESLAASVNQTASKLPVRDEMNQPSNVTDFSGPSSSRFGAGLCSNQSVEMKIALTHEQAASEILSSEYNQPASSHLDGIQDSLFVSHDQHDPGQDLLRTHERSSDESKRTSDGSGPNNDSVACAQIGPSVSPACFQPERFSFRLETGVLSEDLREKTLVTEVENLSPAVSSKILQADSDKNPGGLAGSLDKQMYQTSTVSYPGSNLMPERVSCEAPNPSTCPSDAPTNLFVQSDDLESISAHRSASSNTEPYISGPEPKHSASYEVPTYMNSSNKSIPFAPHMTPYGFNCVTDSTTVNNESVQLLPSDGSNPLLSSQFGANATLVPVQPTQMGFGTGSNVQNTSFPVAPQNSNPNSGPAQGTGNMSWAPAPQGNTNVGWGMVAQGNMNMSWGQPAQTIANLNMGLGAQNQVNTMNSSWVAPLQGNTNMNVAWVNPAMGTNQTSGWGGQLQGNFAVNPVWTMLLQGQTNPSPGWVAPAPTNANPNWESPAQGTMNMNAAWGPGQGNINPSLNPSAGNPQSLGSQPPQSGDRRSGQGENLRGNDPGHTNRRLSWNRMQSGGGSSLPPRGQTGICRFHEMGHCKKGASCNYFHP